MPTMKTPTKSALAYGVPPEVRRALLSRISIIVANSIPKAGQVLEGKIVWSPQQVAVFKTMLNKVVPDMTANYHLHEHRERKLSELSADELEAIARGEPIDGKVIDIETLAPPGAIKGMAAMPDAGGATPLPADLDATETELINMPDARKISAPGAGTPSFGPKDAQRDADAADLKAVEFNKAVTATDGSPWQTVTDQTLKYDQYSARLAAIPEGTEDAGLKRSYKINYKLRERLTSTLWRGVERYWHPHKTEGQCRVFHCLRSVGAMPADKRNQACNAHANAIVWHLKGDPDFTFDPDTYVGTDLRTFIDAFTKPEAIKPEKPE